MNHQKTRRIMAIIGIIILAGLYITTLILALIGTEDTTPWFMACICATIIVPVMIWVYTWLYNRLRSDVSEAQEKAAAEQASCEKDRSDS